MKTKAVLTVITVMVSLTLGASAVHASALVGTNGSDNLVDLSASGTVVGLSGSDIEQVGIGSHRIIGGPGLDTLFTAPGDQNKLKGNFLNGGPESDTIHIAAGDVAIGGSGADTFTVEPGVAGSGIMAIRDFSVGQGDILDLTQMSALGSVSVAYGKHSTTFTAASTVIEVVGVTEKDAANFIF